MELSNDAVLRELGERIASVRLDLNLTQAEVAREAGISKRSVERLESGQVATQLSSFLSVCRTLGMIERFDALLPVRTVSPIALLKLQGRQRQRASRNVVKEHRAWTWGEPT